jgi:hypothetical protein
VGLQEAWATGLLGGLTLLSLLSDTGRDFRLPERSKAKSAPLPFRCTRCHELMQFIGSGATISGRILHLIRRQVLGWRNVAKCSIDSDRNA